MTTPAHGFLRAHSVPLYARTHPYSHLILTSPTLLTPTYLPPYRSVIHSQHRKYACNHCPSLSGPVRYTHSTQPGLTSGYKRFPLPPCVGEERVCRSEPVVSEELVRHGWWGKDRERMDE